MDFLEWLVDGVVCHRPKEIQVLVYLYNQKLRPVPFAELVKELEVTTEFLTNLKRKGYIIELANGFNLLNFWHAKTEFETWSPPKEKTKLNESILVNKLFHLWVDAFNPDLPTGNIYAINKRHAKRLLKSRDLAYWEGIINAAKEDSFWKKSCRNSLSTLEKAAVPLSSQTNDNDLSSYFENKA